MSNAFEAATVELNAFEPGSTPSENAGDPTVFAPLSSASDNGSINNNEAAPHRLCDWEIAQAWFAARDKELAAQGAIQGILTDLASLHATNEDVSSGDCGGGATQQPSPQAADGVRLGKEKEKAAQLAAAKRTQLEAALDELAQQNGKCFHEEVHNRSHLMLEAQLALAAAQERAKRASDDFTHMRDAQARELERARNQPSAH